MLSNKIKMVQFVIEVYAFLKIIYQSKYFRLYHTQTQNQASLSYL